MMIPVKKCRPGMRYHALDRERVDKYRAMLRAGLVAPPINVEAVASGNYFLISEGMHRVESSIREGREFIDATVKEYQP